MQPKRMSDAMEQLLNRQATREALQAQVYLSFGSWAEVNGFGGIADFLYKHMHEEREHMFKFIRFVNGRGGKAVIEAIDGPSDDPENISDCLRRALRHEIDNSTAINDIVNLAHEEKDWATFNFAQWFVKEQIEEEALISNLIDKYKLASDEQPGNANLYSLDRDISGTPQEATIPREEEI